MNNFVQKADVVDLVAPTGGTTAGSMYLIGAILGVSVNTLAAGVSGPFAIKGRVSGIPKLSTDVVTQGAILYWDNTNFRLTLTATSNTKAGFAAVAAGSGVTTADIVLNGTV